MLPVGIIAVFFGGCAFDPAPALPGISRHEAEALRRSYVWFGRLPPVKSSDYSDAALAALFAESTDPTFDGGRADSHTYALALALVTAGDDRFAAVLVRQPRAIRAAVLREVAPLWTHNHLRYPRTGSLLH